ncbi:hypothetical protein Tco_0504137, partial [Tanacetum coccineum]
NKRQRQEESIINAIRSWGVPGGSLQLVKETSSGSAPILDATLQELKAKHPFTSAPSLPDIPIDHNLLIVSQDVVLDRIKSFP